MNSNPRGPQAPQRPNAPQNHSAPSSQRPPQAPNARPTQARPMGTPQRPMQTRPSGAPQRPPQGPYRAPQRPPQRPSRPPQKKNTSIPTAFWVILIATVVVIAALLITLTVFLIRANDRPSEPSGGGGGGGQTPKETTVAVPLDPKKTKPALSAPSRNNYAISSEGVPTIEGISSQAAVLIDLSSYRAVVAKNADVKIHPASMTKVMTLLVACEEIAKTGNDVYLEDLLTVTQAQVQYQSDMGASGNMGFVAGEQVSVLDMLYLINYHSDTIACLAVAERIAGSEAAFVALMNQKASNMGLSNTHFVNVTGLQDNNHYTTCSEMAAIMAAALDNPLAKQIITSYQGRGLQIYQNGVKSRTGTIYAAWYSGKDRFNDNPRLSTVTVKGGKTGYEDMPTACFVTYAEGKAGGKYICVTVGRITDGATVSASTSTADTKKIYNNYVS